MNSTKKRISRIVSLVICIAMLTGFGVVRFSLDASAVSPVRVVGGKAVSTSTGAFIQAYIGSEKGVSTQVSFYAATQFDVFGFSAFDGGNISSVKSDPSERHLGGADGDFYVTWSTDRSRNPYQAFEADVRGAEGVVILGYEGRLNASDTTGTMIMQVWDPSAASYVKMDEAAAVNGSISLVAEVGVAAYAENGLIRYRVVLPENAAYKWIYTRNATAGQVDESLQYGTTKTRTSPGNTSYNYKGTVTSDMCFCVKTQVGDDAGYSMVFPFVSENVAQNQLSHFNVNFKDDAGTARNMSWMSQNDLAAAVVQVVPYGKLNPDFTDAVTYTGAKSKLKNAEKPYCFCVTVDGLEPGAEYWYRYGDGDKIWSNPCYLRTDDGDADFAFIMGGDPQSYTDSEEEDKIERIFGQYRQVAKSWNEAVRTVGAEFLVVCGDESDHGNYEKCWEWYYDTNKAFYRNSTLAPTMGNHDSWGWDMWIANHFLSDPDTGERGSYCSFDYGNAHFIILNGNIAEANNRKAMLDKEYAWLIRDLEAHKDADFKFIIEHQGMYSYPVHTNEAETVEIRSLLVPIIDEYGVDIMMQGHDHIWLRTNSMKGGADVSGRNTTTITDAVTGDTYIVDPEGTTYVNGGSLTGSKYHNPNPTNFPIVKVACAAQPNLPTFNTIEIKGGKLIFKGWVYKSDGSLARIGDYSHYGNYTDGYSIVKTSYYDKLNARINALPDELTLADREEVLALKKACDAESETFLNAYVPDAGKLAAAYETVEQLYNDSCVPVITIDGEMPGEFKVGTEYVFPTASAYDENDGDLPVSVTLANAEGTVTLDGLNYTFEEAGDYVLTYSATDSDGHTTTETFAITVQLGVMKGDMDGDGEISVSDALIALRIAAKLAEETPEAVAIGDADGDGEITVSDALRILRVAAKLAVEV
ncbi:MAG: metallophosphoesterase [Clostridia bacterium]|nr:metallophosphoesterase [Clostridia bacterium]